MAAKQKSSPVSLCSRLCCCGSIGWTEVAAVHKYSFSPVHGLAMSPTWERPLGSVLWLLLHTALTTAVQQHLTFPATMFLDDCGHFCSRSLKHLSGFHPPLMTSRVKVCSPVSPSLTKRRWGTVRDSILWHCGGCHGDCLGFVARFYTHTHIARP